MGKGPLTVASPLANPAGEPAPPLEPAAVFERLIEEAGAREDRFISQRARDYYVRWILPDLHFNPRESRTAPLRKSPESRLGLPPCHFLLLR
jgi:hypothetical protein